MRLVHVGAEIMVVRLAGLFLVLDCDGYHTDQGAHTANLYLQHTQISFAFDHVFFAFILLTSVFDL